MLLYLAMISSLVQIIRVTITEFAYFLNPYKVDKLMFLQDATMTATQHVVTVTSLNSLHFVFYAVRKILKSHRYTCHLQ